MNVTQNNTRQQIQQANQSLQNRLTKSTPGGKEALGKEDFLNLLMAQVTHQDPLNPMDSQGMMNQLTSMGSLEQMINMNKQLGSLNQVQSDVARANAYTFLDKDVTVKGGAAQVRNGTATDLRFQLPREASNVSVGIVDKAGVTIRTLELGAQGGGSHVVGWDGKDKDGDPVLDGTYQYAVSAKSPENESLPVDTYMTGKVSGVRFDNGKSLLKVNGQEIDAREIIELSNQSQRLFSTMQPLPLKEDLQPAPPFMEPRRK